MDNNENNQQTNENQYTEQPNYNQPNYNQQQYSQPNYNQQQFNPQYQAPMYQPPIEDTTPLSTGQWVLTILTTIVLPFFCLIGLVVACVWAFSSNGNVNRRNFARASLICWAIIIGLIILFFVILAAIGIGLADLAYSSYYYY